MSGYLRAEISSDGTVAQPPQDTPISRDMPPAQAFDKQRSSVVTGYAVETEKPGIVPGSKAVWSSEFNTWIDEDVAQTQGILIEPIDYQRGFDDAADHFREEQMQRAVEADDDDGETLSSNSQHSDLYIADTSEEVTAYIQENANSDVLKSLSEALEGDSIDEVSLAIQEGDDDYVVEFLSENEFNGNVDAVRETIQQVADDATERAVEFIGDGCARSLYEWAVQGDKTARRILTQFATGKLDGSTMRQQYGAWADSFAR